ncbi:MAG: 30S ribosomal protein S14 [Alphaproteobacteria bacterium]|nr:30S ribosomal protein S14 [Alphaproteobacteria bacterium]MDD9919520.1 30S ribosomal protein S14 [Alphaproteobacteria bacterium]
MAKVGMINREAKRTRLANRDGEKRIALKAIIKNEELSFEERMAARDKLNKLPRDGAKIRGRNRCQFTGRPRGYHRRFGISRVALRQMAANGLLPGVKKASW